MNDSDPRPMPPQVLAAYRDPLELGELFATKVFTDEDRLAVRDELFRRLVGKYGNAEIESGSKLVTVKQRVARLKQHPWKSIDLLMSVPEHGGKDAVKLELAHVMQPYWAKWWDGFEWSDRGSIWSWQDTARIVLGDRQLRWLAAQYARDVISFGLPDDREVRLKAIGVRLDTIAAAEAYSFDPTKENLERMYESGIAAFHASHRHDAVYYAADSTYAAYAAAAASNAVDAKGYVAATSTQLAELASLTKRLITPTLITSPSRGLR